MVRRIGFLVVALVALLASVSLGPSAASAAPGDTTLVFVRGMDDAVWFRALDHATGTWRSWQTLGGGVTGVPRGELTPDGRIAVFARGLDSAVWMRTSFDMVTWTPWESLGGFLLGDPALVYTPWITEDGEADVVVIGWGGDYQPWARSYAGTTGTWSGWRRISSMLGTGPAIAWADEATRSVYVSGMATPVDPRQRQVQADRFDARMNWTSGYVVGGPGVAEAAILSGGQGTFVGFSRLFGGQLGGIDPSSRNWQNLGGILLDAPRFGPTLGGVATALGRGADHGVWWHGPGGWSTLGGLVLESPTGDYIDDTRFLLTARGTDQGVWLRWWNDSTGTWSGWETLGGLARNEPSQLTVLTSGAE